MLAWTFKILNVSHAYWPAEDPSFSGGAALEMSGASASQFHVVIAEHTTEDHGEKNERVPCMFAWVVRFGYSSSAGDSESVERHL